jgi:hypothetical protein
MTPIQVKRQTDMAYVLGYLEKVVKGRAILDDDFPSILGEIRGILAQDLYPEDRQAFLTRLRELSHLFVTVYRNYELQKLMTELEES